MGLIIFKAIHKILHFVHEKDLQQREKTGLYANPVKEELNNPKGMLRKIKDKVFEKTLGAADTVDNALASGMGKVKEYAVDPLVEGLPPIEMGQIGMRPRI
jgi:hypothetical protein